MTSWKSSARIVYPMQAVLLINFNMEYEMCLTQSEDSSVAVFPVVTENGEVMRETDIGGSKISLRLLHVPGTV